MSLIHDALKEMERPAAAATNALPRSGQPPAPAAKAPALDARLALAGIALLAAAGGAWWYATRGAAPAPVPAPPPAQAAVALNAPPAPPAPSAPANEGWPAHSASPQRDAAPQVAYHHAPPAGAARAEPVARRPKAPRAAPKAAVAKAAAAAEMPVEKRYALFRQALAVGDLAQARSELDALERMLSPESVTLLRARAWYATHVNDTASARKSYRAILERLPGDENAGLNLAALEAREGRTEAARGLLSDVLQANPDSSAAQLALRRLKESVQ